MTVMLEWWQGDWPFYGLLGVTATGLVAVESIRVIRRLDIRQAIVGRFDIRREYAFNFAKKKKKKQYLSLN